MKSKAYLVFLLILLINCTDHNSDFYERTYPIPKTNQVTYDEVTGDFFNGEVVELNGNTIEDHGFVWSDFSTSSYNHRISLGPLGENLKFSFEINNFQKGKTYAVRAYVISAETKKEVYASEIRFVY